MRQLIASRRRRKGGGSYVVHWPQRPGFIRIDGELKAVAAACIALGLCRPPEAP